MSEANFIIQYRLDFVPDSLLGIGVVQHEKQAKRHSFGHCPGSTSEEVQQRHDQLLVREELAAARVFVKQRRVTELILVVSRGVYYVIPQKLTKLFHMSLHRSVNASQVWHVSGIRHASYDAQRLFHGKSLNVPDHLSANCAIVVEPFT